MKKFLILVIILISLVAPIGVFAVTDPILYEAVSSGGDTDSIPICSNNWTFQQFTVGTSSHTVTSINLYLKKTGLPGDVKVSIRKATAGLPTGVDLYSKTLDGDSFGTSYSWVQFEFTEAGLEGNQQYAVIIRALQGDASNHIHWQYHNGSVLANAQFGDSFDGSVSWSAASPVGDALFEVWGNPALEIQDVKVFQGYRETDDWLIVIRYNNMYAPYYSTYDIKKYFVFQLLDLSSVVRAQTPVPTWGNSVGNIYLSTLTASSLEWGKDYNIRMYGIFSGNPYVEYTLSGTDWLGTDLTQLDSWVITSASVIGDYYNANLTTYISGRGEVLNSTGGSIFNTGISGLSVIRPNIFQISTKPQTHTTPGYTQPTKNQNWEAKVGPQITTWLNAGADIFAVDGRTFGVMILVLIMVIISGWGLAANHTIAANILAFPVLFIAGGFDLLDWVLLGVVFFCAGILLIYQLWLKNA